MMFGVSVLWLFLIFLFVWGIIAFINYTEARRNITEENKSAIDILRERYARGEIDKKEFKEREHLLSH